LSRARSRDSRAGNSDALEERGEVLEAEAGGDVVDARIADRRLERVGVSQLAERRTCATVQTMVLRP
jgi:hypothetical protein